MPIGPPPRPPLLPGEKEAEEYRRRQDDFHLRLGYCIAKWAEVENELFRIFWTGLRSSKEQAATVYYYIRSLEQRVTLTDELMGWLLPKTQSGGHHHPDLKEWNAICTEFRDLLPTRNRLAHHPVEGEIIEWVIVPPKDSPSSGGHVVGHGYDSWFSIAESEQERLRGRGKKPERLDAGHLAAHLDRTTILARWLEQFWRDKLPVHVAALPRPSDPYNRGLVPNTHPTPAAGS